MTASGKTVKLMCVFQKRTICFSYIVIRLNDKIYMCLSHPSFSGNGLMVDWELIPFECKTKMRIADWDQASAIRTGTKLLPVDTFLEDFEKNSMRI